MMFSRMATLVASLMLVDVAGFRINQKTNRISETAVPADDQVSPLEDSTHCEGGSNRTSCPRRGDNQITAGGGGPCKFRYTFHDGQGEGTGAPVVTSGECTITPADLNEGSHTNTRVRGWIRSLAAHDGFETDDAGHILANQLGGCGTCPVNLFPQNLMVNRGIYRLMETAIYDCVSEAQDVTAHLTWKFNYKRPALQHLRPDTYTYTATFKGGSCQDMSATFDNVQWYPSSVMGEDDEPWMQVSG